MLRVVLFFSPNFCMMFVNPLKWFNDLVFVIHELSYSNFFRTHRKKRELNSLKTGYGENCLVHKPSESCFEAQIAFSLRKGWWPDHQTSIYWIRDEIKSHPKGRNWISCPVLNGQCLVQEKHHFCQKLIRDAVHWYPFFKLY